MKPSRVRMLARTAVLAAAGLACAAPAAGAPGARAAATRPAAAPHVVIVGISGLRWSDISAAATPALWRLASAGSIGSLEDHAVRSLTCPADAWLTLNVGDRAQAAPGATCRPVPVAVRGAAASIPGMPALIRYNAAFNYNQDWGLLASGASCSTAVGPGAALALAGRRGTVASYLPSAAELSGAALARCPLTAVDLGNLTSPERAVLLHHADAALARIDAGLPAGSLLLVIAPGATALPAHLQVAIAAGPGYRAGLLTSTSTRQPGLVLLTDLTATVLGWLGHPAPAGLPGAPVTSVSRAAAGPAIGSLAGRDVAEQVWASTHAWFLIGYALAVLAAFAAIRLGTGGPRGIGYLRVAAVYACSVPVATFLANLVPWYRFAVPALGLYGVAAMLAAVAGSGALAAGAAIARTRAGAGWWVSAGPFGILCLFTLVVLAADVATGSRLQLDAPFGLGLVAGDRYYGIGNAALGCYGIAALGGAAWLGMAARSRRASLLAVSAVGAFAVVVSGWPGFGAKAGGTIAIVPPFVLLLAVFAGVRVTWRRALVILASGLLLFAVFALASYLLPGRSDISSFAGDLLHGRGGGLLRRKIDTNLGSLAVSGYSPLVPALVAVAAIVLLRPGWVLPPRLRMTLWTIWLMPVLGWLADDGGVLVPACAFPMAFALCAGIVASVSYRDEGTRYRGTAVAGPSVAGQLPTPG